MLDVLATAAVIILLIVGVFCGAYHLDKVSCMQRWQSFNPTYYMNGGCMIEYEGKRMPADVYRTNVINLE